MRTFAAAAIMAASASAFDVMAAPDFVAGFIYGMTGDNHLTEIEACYNGGEQIVKDTETAFADFKAGHYFAGLKEAGTVWNEVSSSLTTCKGMEDDIAAIELWAQIFTEPTKLSKTVAKNWLLHGSKIKADIATEQADWTAKNYFKAGQDTADALTLAVGPIKPASGSNMPTMPIKAPFLFLGGLLEGFVGDNHLTEIQLCATDAEGIVTKVESVVADIEASHWVTAAEDIETIVTALPAVLTACKGMDEDIAAIKAWAQIFKSKSDVIATVTKHMIFHKTEIMTDLNNVKSDWAATQYFKSGKAAADLITVAIGPIQAEAPKALPKLDLLMVPELAAGFLYGMVGDNHLTEFQSCYTGVTPLWNDLEAALKDIEAFHIFGAIKQFEKFVFNFKTDSAPCHNVSDDLKAVEVWAQIFKNPTSLVSTVTKHYLLHKGAVTADITAAKTDFAAKSYFATGKDAADLLTILIGPVQ